MVFPVPGRKQGCSILTNIWSKCHEEATVSKQKIAERNRITKKQIAGQKTSAFE
jgi:hypothetical protein